MGRGPLPKYEHPELPVALDWLRHRANLTQGQVAKRVQEAGHSLSEVYYRQCESGLKTPSNPTLASILAAVGSDFDELDGLLTHAPWDAISEPQQGRSEGYRLRQSTPKPALYSPPVTAVMKSLASTPNALGDRMPPRPDTPLVANLISGEIAELADIYFHLSRGDQINTMALARSRDKRRRQ